ncbi:MAG: class I SAM-dependent methyltransferase, partial [Bacteroidota bacterium]
DKGNGHFLELGTGAGLALSWMLAGMNQKASVISLDNDQQLIDIALKYLGNRKNTQILCTDGAEWIKNYSGPPFDLIFADTWPGKYNTVPETLALLNPGGYYVIDDMRPADDWPTGHAEKATQLTEYLFNHPELNCVELDWSTGVILAVKKRP